MFRRLLRYTHWAAGIATGITAANFVVQKIGEPAFHEGPLVVSAVVLWALAIDLRSREAMRQEILAKVDAVTSGICRGLDEHKMEALLRVLTDKRQRSG